MKIILALAAIVVLLTVVTWAGVELLMEHDSGSTRNIERHWVEFCDRLDAKAVAVPDNGYVCMIDNQVVYP